MNGRGTQIRLEPVAARGYYSERRNGAGADNGEQWAFAANR
jgi:hypothetical protein